MTAALGRGRVDAVAWERIGEEFGFASVVARGRLRGEGVPASLVAKLPSAQPERDEREARFYRDVGAAFAPALLGARDGVLLLEDVPGAQGDVLAGCSAEEAALVLEAIGSFHAAHAGGRPGFAAWGGDPATWQERYAARLPGFLERHGASLPEGLRELAERLAPRLAAVVAELQAGRRALIHGDLHLDNLLFRARDRPIVVLDWQAAAAGPPAWDVALLLYGSLDVEERRAAEDELLARYLAALGDAGYGPSRLRRDCGLALLAQFAGAVGWLSAPEREGASERERETRRRVLADGRLAAAVLDAAAAG